MPGNRSSCLCLAIMVSLLQFEAKSNSTRGAMRMRPSPLGAWSHSQTAASRRRHLVHAFGKVSQPRALHGPTDHAGICPNSASNLSSLWKQGRFSNTPGDVASRCRRCGSNRQVHACLHRGRFPVRRFGHQAGPGTQTRRSHIRYLCSAQCAFNRFGEISELADTVNVWTSGRAVWADRFRK